MEQYRRGHNEHDWKSCSRDERLEGSNPSCSATSPKGKCLWGLFIISSEHMRAASILPVLGGNPGCAGMRGLFFPVSGPLHTGFFCVLKFVNKLIICILNYIIGLTNYFCVVQYKPREKREDYEQERLQHRTFR